MKKAKWHAVCRTWWVCLTAMLTALATTAPAANVPGKIIKTNGQEVIGEDIRWRGSSKQYVVTRRSVSMNVDKADVARIEVAEPAGLRSAAAAVQRGQPDGASLATLEGIVRDYQMLSYDIPAARWLGAALVQNGSAKKAAAMLEEMIDSYGFSGLPGDLINVYLDALTGSGETPKVRMLLKKMIEEGSPGAVAVALLKRADLLKKDGKYKEALIDGYLRVVVLFEQEKDVQPESLYKAAQCFEELGQAAYAEKMRKKLISEYPQSSFTRQAQAGK